MVTQRSVPTNELRRLNPLQLNNGCNMSEVAMGMRPSTTSYNKRPLTKECAE
jgi:hypothetical protein